MWVRSNSEDFPTNGEQEIASGRKSALGTSGRKLVKRKKEHYAKRSIFPTLKSQLEAGQLVPLNFPDDASQMPNFSGRFSYSPRGSGMAGEGLK
jgi:hypothetical protein